MTIFELVSWQISKMAAWGMSDWCAVISVACILLAYPPYWWRLYSELKRPEQDRKMPRQITWSLWAGLDFVMAAAPYFRNHEIVYTMWVYCFGATTIAVVALLKGEKGWTDWDKAVAVIGGAAIVIWPFTNASVAAEIALFALCVSSIPVWKELWKDTRAEPWPAWACVWIGSVWGIIAMGPFDNWEWAKAFGQLGFFGLNTIIILLMLPLERPVPTKAQYTTIVTESYPDGSWDALLLRNGAPMGQVRVGSLTTLLEQSRH